MDAKGGSDRTLGKYDPMLWSVAGLWSCDCWCFCFRATGTDSDPDPDPVSTASPFSDPLVDAPLFVLDVLDLLPKRSLPCHGGRNENVAPNGRRCSGFDSGVSRTESCGLGGVNGGGVVRFGNPKWNGFDAALAPGWEAVALWLLRCNFFGERGAVSALSFVLVPGSEMGLGRRASAAAPFGCGLAVPGGTEDWCISNV